MDSKRLNLHNFWSTIPQFSSLSAKTGISKYRGIIAEEHSSDSFQRNLTAASQLKAPYVLPF